MASSWRCFSLVLMAWNLCYETSLLVDYLQSPRWNPAKVEDVDMREVSSVFEPLPPGTELSA